MAKKYMVLSSGGSHVSMAAQNLEDVLNANPEYYPTGGVGIAIGPDGHVYLVQLARVHAEYQEIAPEQERQ